MCTINLDRRTFFNFFMFVLYCNENKTIQCSALVWTHGWGDTAGLSPGESKACGAGVIYNFIHNDAFGTHSQDQLSKHRLLLTGHSVKQFPVLWKLLSALWGSRAVLPSQLDRLCNVGHPLPIIAPEKLFRPNGVCKNIWPVARWVIMGLNKSNRWQQDEEQHKQMQLSHFPSFSFFIFTPF